jgi:transposase-like protein
MAHTVKVSANEKVEMVRQYCSGKSSLSLAAKKLGVHDSTILDWVRLYQNEGIAGMLPILGLTHAGGTRSRCRS